MTRKLTRRHVLAASATRLTASGFVTLGARRAAGGAEDHAGADRGGQEGRQGRRGTPRSTCRSPRRSPRRSRPSYPGRQR